MTHPVVRSSPPFDGHLLLRAFGRLRFFSEAVNSISTLVGKRCGESVARVTHCLFQVEYYSASSEKATEVTLCHNVTIALRCATNHAPRSAFLEYIVSSVIFNGIVLEANHMAQCLSHDNTNFNRTTVGVSLQTDFWLSVCFRWHENALQCRADDKLPTTEICHAHESFLRGTHTKCHLGGTVLELKKHITSYSTSVLSPTSYRLGHYSSWRQKGRLPVGAGNGDYW